MIGHVQDGGLGLDPLGDVVGNREIASGLTGSVAQPGRRLTDGHDGAVALSILESRSAPERWSSQAPGVNDATAESASRAWIGMPTSSCAGSRAGPPRRGCGHDRAVRVGRDDAERDAVEDGTAQLVLLDGLSVEAGGDVDDEASTYCSSPIAIGLRPISIGISVPSLRGRTARGRRPSSDDRGARCRSTGPGRAFRNRRAACSFSTCTASTSSRTYPKERSTSCCQEIRPCTAIMTIAFGAASMINRSRRSCSVSSSGCAPKILRHGCPSPQGRHPFPSGRAATGNKRTQIRDHPWAAELPSEADATSYRPAGRSRPLLAFSGGCWAGRLRDRFGETHKTEPGKLCETTESPAARGCEPDDSTRCLPCCSGRGVTRN